MTESTDWRVVALNALDGMRDRIHSYGLEAQTDQPPLEDILGMIIGYQGQLAEILARLIRELDIPTR